MRVMETGSVDLVVTSPPYDDLRTYGGLEWDFYGVARELTRVLKPGGVIVWVVADKTENGSETLTSMRQAIHFKDVCGLNVHDTMIWNKYLPGLYGKRYTFAWEYMLILSKGEPNAWNPIKRKNLYMGKRGASSRNLNGSSRDGITEVTAEESIEENVWRIPVGGGITSKDGSRHPAAFPDDLAAKHITTWTNPGEIVLDPFAGSGTTIKAAKELGRQAIGIEINPEYVKIINNRLRQDALALGV
jgi:site-specific DNA-methyltransferase (adenine-specific)